MHIIHRISIAVDVMIFSILPVVLSCVYPLEVIPTTTNHRDVVIIASRGRCWLLSWEFSRVRGGREGIVTNSAGYKNS